MLAEEAIENVHGTQYVCDQLINLVGMLHSSVIHQTQAFPNVLQSL